MNFLLVLLLLWVSATARPQVPETVLWKKYELTFPSTVNYENPVQDLRSFQITFISPTGNVRTINGFWDGENTWKARFMPDETGDWKWETNCSDSKNAGLHNVKGEFRCIPNNGKSDLDIHGKIIRQNGLFYLTHADGTPFLYIGCTAWNGALKSTDKEWDQYLEHRASHQYSVIQLVTTQWRGCEKNSMGQVAFEGSGKIRINPEFFRHLDKKIDLVNEYGLVAAPVILWALQTSAGRELSPGYYLPDDQAILLAKYIVARYGANHVIWLLGGDGIYTGIYEQRWKTIGRAVFDGTHQGIVAQHPCGRSWIGNIYKDEKWLDIVGYQSSHSNDKGTVEWITKGPMSREWSILPARPLINLEPNYEQIRTTITDKDVRNAVFWSLFTAPVSGVTYGANGIWPWLREGEKILNHADAPWTDTWDKSINLPGSLQMKNIASFLKSLEWWNLYPAQELLVEQPGDKAFNEFVSVVKAPDNKIIVVYVPVRTLVKIRKSLQNKYSLKWFNPVTNKYSGDTVVDKGNVMEITPADENDMVAVLIVKK
ncbi:MAG: apiosidase-like domain-containing protein [Bacteroidales bacterium]